MSTTLPKEYLYHSIHYQSGDFEKTFYSLQQFTFLVFTDQ